ncbi:hypothetical protein DPMN_070467 [Dreissena polymorpha]|uniref:Uncharacterized protein n=1 Tax=Dreissena polymorpha TaxID=45954 RepID=A0A9D3Z685_DREPO|nr:hypothetical protein DPMN_070467 [Dreissena polymorpha]
MVSEGTEACLSGESGLIHKTDVSCISPNIGGWSQPASTAAEFPIDDSGEFTTFEEDGKLHFTQSLLCRMPFGLKASTGGIQLLTKFGEDRIETIGIRERTLLWRPSPAHRRRLPRDHIIRPVLKTGTDGLTDRLTDTQSKPSELNRTSKILT